MIRGYEYGRKEAIDEVLKLIEKYKICGFCKSEQKPDGICFCGDNHWTFCDIISLKKEVEKLKDEG